MSRFYQFLELVFSLLDWILDKTDPISEEEIIESLKNNPTSVQKAYLESCLNLEYKVKRNAS